LFEPGSIFTTSLEPILSKIPDQWKPPRRPPPMTAARLAEKYSLQFLILRARRIFLPRLRQGFGGQVKRKQTFLWCSALNEQAAGLRFRLGRGGRPSFAKATDGERRGENSAAPSLPRPTERLRRGFIPS
jgi:hypothetical protein